MSRATIVLVAVIAAAVGGISGAATTSWLRPGPAAASSNASATDYDDLSARLDSLEAQVARLAQQRATVIVAPPPTQGSQEPDARAAARAVDDPVFEAAVRDVVDRIEQDRNAERETRRAERQAQQARRWADRLAVEASLSEDQKTRVIDIAHEYIEKLRQASQADGGPLSPEERNERRSAARADAEKKLGQTLSPRQMQTYQGSDGLGLEALARGARSRGAQ